MPARPVEIVDQFPKTARELVKKKSYNNKKETISLTNQLTEHDRVVLSLKGCLLYIHRCHAI